MIHHSPPKHWGFLVSLPMGRKLGNPLCLKPSSRVVCAKRKPASSISERIIPYPKRKPQPCICRFSGIHELIRARNRRPLLKEDDKPSLPHHFHTSYTIRRRRMRLKPAWLRGHRVGFDFLPITTSNTKDLAPDNLRGFFVYACHCSSIAPFAGGGEWPINVW